VAAMKACLSHCCHCPALLRCMPHLPLGARPCSPDRPTSLYRLGRSKQIHFGVMSPAEMVNTAEFHVYERALYKASRQ